MAQGGAPWLPLLGLPARALEGWWQGAAQASTAGSSPAINAPTLAAARRDTFFSDLWSYNPATGKWRCLCARAPFPARANHTSTVVGDALWVVGGSSLADVYADAHVFDLREHTWSTPQLR